MKIQAHRSLSKCSFPISKQPVFLRQTCGSREEPSRQALAERKNLFTMLHRRPRGPLPSRYYCLTHFHVIRTLKIGGEFDGNGKELVPVCGRDTLRAWPEPGFVPFRRSRSDRGKRVGMRMKRAARSSDRLHEKELARAVGVSDCASQQNGMLL